MRALAILAVVAGCGSSELAPDADPRCATTATAIATHPHAREQSSADGRTLVDVRSWHHRLYFGYGDLALNTGPIWISSFDPATGAWVDHTLLDTEKIQRFYALGDHLWAPAADTRGDPATNVEYAVGDADHNWTGGIDIGPAEHVMTAIERAPGDVYLTGEIDFDVTKTPIVTTGSVWRSQNGEPFVLIFPDAGGDRQLDTWFFNAAALGGLLYVGFNWVFDGTQWIRSPVDFNEFKRATVFADRIVSATLGKLWAYDGARMTDLGVTLFPSVSIEPTTVTPVPVFSDSEDHLLAVVDDGAVMATTDLETWTCIGRAPADVASIGSLDHTVYFGGTEGRIYAFPAPSW